MKSNNSFIKKQKAEEKRKKRIAKLDKKHQKKNTSAKVSWEMMIAYIDEQGNITSERPLEDDLTRNENKTNK